jgi:hypothetical protein
MATKREGTQSVRKSRAPSLAALVETWEAVRQAPESVAVSELIEAIDKLIALDPEPEVLLAVILVVERFAVVCGHRKPATAL